MEVKKHGRKSRRFRGGNKLSIIIIIAALVVASFAAYKVYGILSSYKKAEAIYENASVEYIDVGDISVEENEMWWAEDVLVDFLALKEKYPDCVAWIRSDDPEATSLNYPLMWDGTDTTYLRADPEGNYLYSGSLFIEGKNSPDMTDYHTIIYGHNMKDGSMFGMLRDYSWEEGFYEANKYFTVYTEDMVYRYEIYSWHVTSDTSYVYTVGLKAGREYEEFISSSLADAETDTGIVPDISQKILTLSTCTSAGNDDERFVVHAVCIDECESSAAASGDSTESDNSDTVILKGTIE